MDTMSISNKTKVLCPNTLVIRLERVLYHQKECDSLKKLPRLNSSMNYDLPTTSTQNMSTVTWDRTDRSDNNIAKSKQPYFCNICEKSVSYTGRGRHLRTHTGEKPYSCKYCCKNFSEKGNLFTHEITHTGEKPLTCKQCDKTFSVYSKWKNHMRVHVEKNIFKCKECKKCFSHPDDLRKHVIGHRNEKQTYSCKMCREKYSTEDDLNFHMKIHDQDNSLKRKCTQPNELCKNEAANWTNRKVYHICEVCGKQYAHKESLDRHKRRIHTGEKIFQCTYMWCKKKFTQKGHLKCHMLTHTLENPFKCNFCAKILSSKHGFQIHIRYHLGEKPYICQICGKGFADRKAREVHLNIHTGEKPYLCQLCEKKYADPSTLRDHVKCVHKKGKRFTCTFCNKQFGLHNSLNNHMRIHTGEKPYSCNKCESSFRHQTCLRVHRCKPY